jgi:hypothetical protein
MARGNLRRSIAFTPRPSTHAGCSQRLPDRIELLTDDGPRSGRRPISRRPDRILRSVFADSNLSDDEETFTRERRGHGCEDRRVRERMDLS